MANTNTNNVLIRQTAIKPIDITTMSLTPEQLERIKRIDNTHKDVQEEQEKLTQLAKQRGFPICFKKETGYTICEAKLQCTTCAKNICTCDSWRCIQPKRRECTIHADDPKHIWYVMQFCECCKPYCRLCNLG